MRKFTQIILMGFIFTLALNITACSDDKDETTEKKESKGDHVWKQQTDTLKSAKEMAKKMQESLNQQQQTLDESE